MSDEIKLSKQLIDDLRSVMVTNDSQAEEDLIFAQYLAASMGYLLGEQQMPQQQKEEILQQLFQFTSHVVEQQSTPQPAPDSLGHWKPGDP